MANYEIKSGYSPDGAALSIPIDWSVDNPITDITVYTVSPNGTIDVCQTWSWNDANKTVNIQNTSAWANFSAYVIRSEAAEMLTQLVSSGEIQLQDLISQFQKNVRVLEQLQEFQKTALRTPDYPSVLPNAANRAGKFLSFDEDGNPVANVAVDTFETSKAAAAKSAEDAEEQYNNCLEISSIIGGYVSVANTAKTKAEAAATAATTKANEAGIAETNAQTAKTAAETAQRNAETAADGAYEAKLSAETAKADAEDERGCRFCGRRKHIRARRE